MTVIGGKIIAGDWFCPNHIGPVVAQSSHIRSVTFQIAMMREVIERWKPEQYFVTKRLRPDAKPCCCLGDEIMHEINKRTEDLNKYLCDYVCAFGQRKLRP